MEAYIYGIKNKRNGKIYVGKTTVNIKKRIWYHKNKLKRNVHDNYNMQEDFNSSNSDFEELFEYGIIEKITKDNIIELNRLEKKYIEQYGTYNIFQGSNTDFKVNQKLSESHKNQKSEKRLLNKNQVFEILSLLYFFECSIRPVATLTKVNRTTIKSLRDNMSYREYCEDFNNMNDKDKWLICKHAIKKYNYCIEKLTIYPTLIKSLVLLLSNEYNISMRNIEKILSISKELQRRIKNDIDILNFYSTQDKDFLRDVFETVYNQSCAELRKYSKKVQRPVSP